MIAGKERGDGVVVIGAGPSGLGAAHGLVEAGCRPLVLEATDRLGGLARTECYAGCRFDVGGHRFHSTVEAMSASWRDILGDDLLEVPRRSRIYYRGRLLRYPLSMGDVLAKLGPVESARSFASYLGAQCSRRNGADSFEDYVVRRFGRRLYEMFFKAYTEKILGTPCNTISSDWASQRISGLSLPVAVRGAIRGLHGTRTMIDRFVYPALGPGTMWERYRDAVVAGGGEVRMKTPVTRLHHRGGLIHTLEVDGGRGSLDVSGRHVISSMPLVLLTRALSPAPPEPVLRAASRLRYRAFVLAALLMDRPCEFPDQWVYIHDPTIRCGRVQNFANWSPQLVAPPFRGCIGVEFFCDVTDDLYAMPDGDLLALAAAELDRLRLVPSSHVVDGVVVREPMAYPLYDCGYRDHVQVVADYINRFENLQTIGRNGQHRYDNQDRAMLTGLLAARNVLGERHDLWRVQADARADEILARPVRANGLHVI